MQKAGFKLTPEDIYNVNKSCIKDAIVGLGNEGSSFHHFCTGEIISPKGLMTTNHHCGYGKLQEHSTVEHDYLRDGFWAYSMEEELPNPGLTASILVRMEDVTAQVKAVINDDMSESDRQKAISNVSKTIEDKAIEGTHYSAKVIPMFSGNQFFLFVHIIYRDVRLVGAPPSSMGKFGGDTDNWSWPRHTCDFSMFRIYTAPDGSPATYSKDNVPLNPKHHLPVSIREINDGDFAMVLGFPGTTNHFITSYGLDATMNITNKLRYEIRSVKIDVLRKQMASSQATRIKYASKYASCSNYWKYSNEQNKALKALNTMGVKLDIEDQYRNWAANKDPKYLKALDLIRDGYNTRNNTMKARVYITEGLIQGPELPWFAYSIGKKIIEANGAENAQPILAQIDKRQTAFYKDYDATTEKLLIGSLFDYVFHHIDPQQCPQFLRDANRKYDGDFMRYADKLMSKSAFTTPEGFKKLLGKGSKAVEKDPLFNVGKEIYLAFMELNNATPLSVSDDLKRGDRDFIDGILQMNAGKAMAPDANSTIRCTYGNVKAYNPRDAVAYSHYTTLRGVIEKEGPVGGEFEVPQRLKDLYAAANYGRYANANGELPTCFITNNDITGGNSGSPVINAHGHLIGLAFDGNSEAMSGDIDFEENLQRCICLDTRYMLWVIDKYAGATNLIDEMTIVQ